MSSWDCTELHPGWCAVCLISIHCTFTLWLCYPLCLRPPKALQLRKGYLVFYPKTSMAEATLVDYPCCMTMYEVPIYLIFKVMFNHVALDITYLIWAPEKGKGSKGWTCATHLKFDLAFSLLLASAFLNTLCSQKAAFSNLFKLILHLL